VLAMQSFKKGVVVDCVLEEGALTIVDMLSIGEFKKNKYVREQSARTARIHEALEDFEVEGVMAAKGSIVNDADRLDRFIKKAVDAGVKAIVTKDTKAVYGVGMTGNWVKVEIVASENKKKKARKKSRRKKTTRRTSSQLSKWKLIQSPMANRRKSRGEVSDEDPPTFLLPR